MLTCSKCSHRWDALGSPLPTTCPGCGHAVEGPPSPPPAPVFTPRKLRPAGSAPPPPPPPRAKGQGPRTLFGLPAPNLDHPAAPPARTLPAAAELKSPPKGRLEPQGVAPKIGPSPGLPPVPTLKRERTDRHHLNIDDLALDLPSPAAIVSAPPATSPRTKQHATRQALALELATDSRTTPDAAELPGLPGLPCLPDGVNPPDLPDLPALPDFPEAADLPETADLPNLPEVVDLPALPDLPEVADLPEAADLPDLPDLPALPDLPDLPALPDLPDLPDLPALPDLPDLPGLPDPNRAAYDAELPIPMEDGLAYEAELPIPMGDVDSLELAPVGEIDLPLPDDAALPVPEKSALPLPDSHGTPAAVAEDDTGKVAARRDTRAGTQLPDASHQQLHPLRTDDVAPLDALELDLDPDSSRPHPLGVAGRATAPEGTATVPHASAAASGSEGLTHDPARVFASRRASPAPRRAPASASLKRTILYSCVGLLVAVVGGGLYSAGAFDTGTDTTAGTGLRPTAPTPAAADHRVKAGEVSPATPHFLAHLDKDTPAEYEAAMDRATKAQNPLEQAEATLLQHHRYGPDAVLLGQARTWLEPYRQTDHPFVQRLLGLEALVDGDLSRAAGLLGGDHLRTQLYRCWLLLQQEKAEDARALAQSVVDRQANNLAAVLAARQAQVAVDPDTGIDALRQSFVAHPDHPAHAAALVRALHDHGLWSEARRIAADIKFDQSTSAEYQADFLALRAKIERQRGDYREAQRLLDQAKTVSEHAEAAAVERIRVNVGKRQYNSVTGELDMLLRQFPKSAHVLLVAAEVALAKGEGDASLTHIDKAATLAPDDPRMDWLRAKVFAMRREVAKARTAYTAARKLDPTFAPATIDEASMLADSFSVAEALDFLQEQRTALAPIDTARSRRAQGHILRKKAELLVAADRSDEALEAIASARAKYGFDNQALLMQAKLLTDAGRRGPADAALVDLYERSGGYPGLASPLGRLFLRRGEYDKIETLLGEKLGHESTPVEHLLIGARLALHRQLYDRATALVDRVLSRDQLNAEAQLLRGKILLAEGHHAESLAQLLQVSNRGDNPELELTIGKALAYAGKPKQAMDRYARARKLDPSELEATALYGRALAFRGSAKQAVAILEPLVQQTEAFPYAHLALGRAYNDLGRKDTAVRHLQLASRADSTLFDAFYWEGRIQADRNKHAEAARALAKGLEKAADTEPNRAEAYRILGKAHDTLGKTGPARQAYKAYLELAPPGATGRADVEKALSRLH